MQQKTGIMFFRPHSAREIKRATISGQLWQGNIMIIVA